MAGTSGEYGVRLHVWGERALFTRPEMKVERVSYDVMTPSAARGILEAIHWKPGIRWVVDEIHVLNPIRFESIRRNEVSSKISVRNAQSAMRSGNVAELATAVDEDRVQRAATILRDVAYVISARFTLTDTASAEDNPGKHADMFRRRARLGQCFQRPCLGVREFAADFELVEGPLPAPHPSLQGTRDLGYMLLDLDYARGAQPVFFRATMQDGVVAVPRMSDVQVAR